MFQDKAFDNFALSNRLFETICHLSKDYQILDLFAYQTMNNNPPFVKEKKWNGSSQKVFKREKIVTNRHLTNQRNIFHSLISKSSLKSKKNKISVEKLPRKICSLSCKSPTLKAFKIDSISRFCKRRLEW